MRKKEKWRQKRKPPFTIITLKDGTELEGTPVTFECSIEETAKQVKKLIRENDERKQLDWPKWQRAEDGRQRQIDRKLR